MATHLSAVNTSWYLLLIVLCQNMGLMPAMVRRAVNHSLADYSNLEINIDCSCT